MWLFLPSLLFVVLVAWCLWRILEKLGLPGCLCVLFFLPVVNVVFLAYVAFADRPAKAPALPDAPTPDDTHEPSVCAQCGATIPARETQCPACGWTYREPAAPPDVPPLEPPSSEKSFRDYRGF